MNFIDNYKKNIIQKLLSHQEILTVYCAATNMPLVVCGEDTFADRVYVFDSDEMLKKFATSIADKKLPLKGIKFPQKDKMAFFTMLLTCNIDEILFMDPTGRHVIQLQDIVKKRDLSDIPKERRPLENPQLKLSGMYFAQEAGRNVPKEEKNLKELEEELSANIVKATFLVPFTLADQPQEQGQGDPGSVTASADAAPAPDGQTTAQDPAGPAGQKQIRMPLIKTPQGDLFQPIFTDHFEFARYNKGNLCKAMAVPFSRLHPLLAKECKGFMINPNGFHLVLTPKMLPGLQQRFGTPAGQ